jgi:hypothetical protein
MVPGSLLGQPRISPALPTRPCTGPSKRTAAHPTSRGYGPERVHGRLERGYEPEDPNFGDGYSTEPERRDFSIVQ